MASDSELDPKESTSLFTLDISYVIGSPIFWQVQMLMVVFLMAVDFFLRLVDRIAEGDRVTEKFVQRLNAELLMFGAVAVAIFVFDEAAPDVSSQTQKLIKFSDVLLSIGACILILIGAWSYVLLLRSKRHYHALTVRRLSAAKHIVEPSCRRRVLGCRFGYGSELQEDLDFLVGAGNITIMLCAPLDVEFGEYCHEVVGQVIIDLIDINLITWFSLLVVSAVGAAVIRTDTDVNLRLALGVCVGLGCGVLVLSLVISALFFDAHRRLRRLYGYDKARTEELKSALGTEIRIIEAEQRELEASFRSYSRTEGSVDRVAAYSRTEASVDRVAAIDENENEHEHTGTDADVDQHGADATEGSDAHAAHSQHAAAHAHARHTSHAAHNQPHQHRHHHHHHPHPHPDPYNHYHHHHAHHMHHAHHAHHTHHTHHAYHTHTTHYTQHAHRAHHAHHTRLSHHTHQDAPVSAAAQLRSPLALQRIHSADAARLVSPPAPKRFVSADAAAPTQPPPRRLLSRSSSVSLPLRESEHSSPGLAPLHIDTHFPHTRTDTTESWLGAAQRLAMSLHERSAKAESEHAAVQHDGEQHDGRRHEGGQPAGGQHDDGQHDGGGADDVEKDSAGFKVDHKPSPKRQVSSLDRHARVKEKLWAARHLGLLRQVLQIVMLLACCLIGMYFLHLLYNIEDANLSGGWHAGVLLPPLLTVLLVLPDTVHRFGVFEAYSVPSESVLDHVLHDVEQRETDLEYVRNQLDHRLCDPELLSRLRQFEAAYRSTRTQRVLRVTLDFIRGKRTVFLEPHHCFVQELLAVAHVPVSRERLSRLLNYFDDEFNHRRVSLDVLLGTLDLEHHLRPSSEASAPASALDQSGANAAAPTRGDAPASAQPPSQAPAAAAPDAIPASNSVHLDLQDLRAEHLRQHLHEPEEATERV